MTGIVLESLTKQYGAGAPAVNNIHLTIAPGTLTVLLGPSGCGKSTTLRMIAGLDTPSHGRILIDGRDVTHLPPAQRRIAMVFQSYALFPHLSVRENILFGLRARKEDKAGFPGRLQRVAELLGLTQLLDRKPSQLSGGQQQRVALGRAVISDASVCLMDEPLSNLDAQLRQDMRREIRQLQQNLGMTMVYVTHDQTEAMSMADQVVVLNQGSIEQTDSPDELYERPRSRFCARFIGTPPMNLITLDIETRAVLAQAWPGWQAPQDACTVGIRPEHITLMHSGNGAVATVESVEFFGADSIVGCRLGSNTGIAVRTPGHAHYSVGTVVQLHWPHAQQRFFNASGLAI